MVNRLFAGTVLAISLLLSVASFAADAPDYSKEAVVIQNLATKVSFTADGAKEWHQTLSVRMQSEAAVRQFGVLAFSYESANEQMKIDYVRVKKADGSVIETPDSSILDVASEVAVAAPTYSDLRQKQIPVKALGAGDVLEYSVHSFQKTPEVAGQFWYDQPFVDDNVILSETLEISVPKDKYVQVFSPKLKSETHDEGGQRVYVWKYSHLEPSKVEDKKASSEKEAPKVQLTTFRNWEEVGSWWGALAAPQTEVTPAIQDKAKELTAGLLSDTEKAQAIYQYVATKFRYISISFGEGRFRPHSAAEVLANQYGDCKDKHTLLAALLKAAGIPAWPALMGAGMKFDATVPSPAQFNHVITVLPQDGKNVWLDTTAEVAPFGLLSQVIRDEQALVIPLGGKPYLVKTPQDPSFATFETIMVKAALTADGTLSGHFDWQTNGDGGLLMRSVFRRLAPTQWQPAAQQLSYGMGFAGEVSGVEVNNLEAIDKPFHFSYEYSRKNFSDWAEHKITPPIPPLGFGPGDEADKPKEAFWAGSPGTLEYQATVQLPKGFSIELPEDATLTSDFADYSSHYSVKDGTLIADRKVVIKKSKVLLDQWEAYQKFSKGLKNDQTTYISLLETGNDDRITILKNNPEALDLMNKAAGALKEGNKNEARDLLAQVERLNPKQAGLWTDYGYLAVTSGKMDEAAADYRKEIQYHPDEIPARQALGAVLALGGRRDEAIEAWRGALTAKPEDPFVAAQVATLLKEAKRDAEIPAMLEKPIAAAPENYYLQVLRVDALLRSGQKDQGMAAAQKIVKASTEPKLLNNLAYSLADTGADLKVAQELGQKALDQTEQDTGKASLASFETNDLAAVSLMAAEWDTMGWVYFKQNDLAPAEKYVNAAWQLDQHAEVADHLGQIYDKQGKHAAAIHMWRLALAANGKYEARERLRSAGAPVNEPVAAGKGQRRLGQPTPDEELGKLRTIAVSALPKRVGAAEFFVLVSKKGIEDVKMTDDSDKSDEFQDAAQAIQTMPYAFPFPDAGQEKVIRRGVLSCSAYTTPSCQFTMFLPSTTAVTPVRAQQASAKQVQDGRPINTSAQPR